MQRYIVNTVSLPGGVFKENSNTATEITPGEACKIRDLLYSQVLEDGGQGHVGGAYRERAQPGRWGPRRSRTLGKGLYEVGVEYTARRQGCSWVRLNVTRSQLGAQAEKESLWQGRPGHPGASSSLGGVVTHCLWDVEATGKYEALKIGNAKGIPNKGCVKK